MLLRKQMYLSTSMITLECNHDYFNEYPNPVSTVKVTLEPPSSYFSEHLFFCCCVTI